jgi:hypothetical protein
VKEKDILAENNDLKNKIDELKLKISNFDEVLRSNEE